LILMHRIFVLQIVQGQYFLDNFRLQIRRTREITGTRGGIYDRNGNPLAYNELANTVIIEGNFTGTATQTRNEVINETLQAIMDIVESNGDSIINDFGIVLDANGNFAFASNNAFTRARFLADIFGHLTIDELTEEEANATPEDIIIRMATHPVFGYGLDVNAYDNAHLLRMINMRYAIDLNSFTQYIPIPLAFDVSDETVAAIMENQSRLGGVGIQQDYLRRYVDSTYFSSIIGFTGKISAEELEALNQNQVRYTANDIVGKAGIEQVMEENLQGTKGSQTFYVDNRGRIRELVDTVEPVAGNSVYLTIDRDIQIWAYRILEEKIAAIVLDRMENVMNYDPANEESSANIIIPADIVYLNIIANGIVNSSAFSSAAEGSASRFIANAFDNRKNVLMSDILDYINNPNGPALRDLSPEMQEILNYIVFTSLSTNSGIFVRSRIPTGNETNQAWINGEINFHQYINYAIGQNWIDVNVLGEFVDLQTYTDATQIFTSIRSVIETTLPNDVGFDRIIYLWLIRNGNINGGQIMATIYEQGVLPMDEGARDGLISGALDPYTWIREKIETLAITPGQMGLEPSTGSVVVSDPQTGDVLALVSYPSYDNNRLANTMDQAYYAQLMNSLSRPFYNNATQERTAPGSTFKMVTAAAGLTEGLIDGGTLIDCTGEFDLVSPHPRCWIYPGAHGPVAVAEALDVSCNVFFYTLGYQLGLLPDGTYDSDVGIQKLAQYATEFGFGAPTGIQIAESTPQISDSISVLSAIGQGTNNFTTSHLNRYVAAIANRGLVPNLTLLDRTTDVNGLLINDYQNEPFGTMSNISIQTWDLITQGMVEMIENHDSFRDLGISMAGKTGTAQQSALNADHALFVGFAPVENPSLAIAVRITNGYASTYAAEVARDIVRAKFNLAPIDEIITGRAATLGTQVHGD